MTTEADAGAMEHRSDVFLYVDPVWPQHCETRHLRAHIRAVTAAKSEWALS